LFDYFDYRKEKELQGSLFFMLSISSITLVN
jgi:hypothetical protein